MVPHLVSIVHFASPLERVLYYFDDEDRVFLFSNLSFFHGTVINLKYCNQNLR